jgi:hypothetical protein
MRGTGPCILMQINENLDNLIEENEHMGPRAVIIY